MLDKAKNFGIIRPLKGGSVTRTLKKNGVSDPGKIYPRRWDTTNY